MTTFATPDTELRRAELDARTRVAWTTYRDELASLAGRAYDDAEAAAWDQLQATLHEIAVERSSSLRPTASDDTHVRRRTETSSDRFHRLVRTLDAIRRTPWTAAGVAVILVIVAAGCGGDDFANDARAPTPLILSASITSTDVTVSPSRLGAGAIELIASNLTPRSQRLTLRSQSLTGGADPLQQRTGPINPGDTASLTADLSPGTYRVTAGSGAIAPATIRVGPARPGAQDELVQP